MKEIDRQWQDLERLRSSRYTPHFLSQTVGTNAMALAKTRQIPYLEKLSNARLAKYCEKMHQSPGFIRWFASAVQAGKRPEEVLARPDVFLDFCLSNVYKYLSELSKKVLRCMLCVPTPSSQAELSFLTELEFIDLQTAIQQLLTTNMIVMSSSPTGSSFESRYTLSDLPREYLLKHHPVDKEEYALFFKEKTADDLSGGEDSG